MLCVIRKFTSILFSLCLSLTLISSCADNDNFASQPRATYQSSGNNQAYFQGKSAISQSQQQLMQTYRELESSVWLAVGQKNSILEHNYIRFATDETYKKSYFSMVVDEPTKAYRRQRFLGSISPINDNDGFFNAFFYRPVACTQSPIKISPPQRNWQENSIRSINVNINQDCVGMLFPHIHGAQYIHKPLIFLNKSDLIHQDLLPNS
ncbi:MAG TPA: hypothetical protein PKC21_05045 [Oligoflexia bacterium]|nr:hypothetical protein [Oligoflexia bacterium]HMR24702.1 hypothetical protein [Oligoflexia bacterium]